MSPKRIQLRRRKGWRLPPNAVSVARPSRWGNPYVVGEGDYRWSGPIRGARPGAYDSTAWVTEHLSLGRGLTVYDAVRLYREGIEQAVMDATAERLHPDDREWAIEICVALADLRGRDLACWCDLDDPCHADVLLDVVNGDTLPILACSECGNMLLLTDPFHQPDCSHFGKNR